MSKYAKHIPCNPKGKQKITAKGPQDCVPMDPKKFADCSAYVAKAFMSAVVLPEEFFKGIPIGSSLSEDSQQRTLIAAFAHFKQNQNLTLSFVLRYNALLKLNASNDLSKWVTKEEGSEFSTCDPDLLTVAARHPLLANGTFDAASFIGEMEKFSAEQQEQPSHVEKPVAEVQNSVHQFPVRTPSQTADLMAA